MLGHMISTYSQRIDREMRMLRFLERTKNQRDSLVDGWFLALDEKEKQFEYAKARNYVKQWQDLTRLVV